MRYPTMILSGLLMAVATVAATAQPDTPATSGVTAAPSETTHCPPAHAAPAHRSHAPSSSPAEHKPRAAAPHPHPHPAAPHRPVSTSTSPCR